MTNVKIMLNVYETEKDGRKFVEIAACDERATGSFRIADEKAEEFMNMVCGYLIDEYKVRV